MSRRGSQVARIAIAAPLSPAGDSIGSESEPSNLAGLSGLVSSVPIELLREGDSPRSNGIDQEHVKLLSGLEGELPPILVHRPTMRVIDGIHRLDAARMRNYRTIDVMYFDGSEEESFLLSVESNIRHGLPLSLRDRKKAAQRILHNFPEWSNRSIAARVGLDHKTIGSIRQRQGDPAAQPDVRVGLDGRVRPLDPADGRRRAQAEIMRNPQASLRDIASSAGVSVETARDVRGRMTPGTAGAAAAGAASVPCQNSTGEVRASATAESASSGLAEIVATLDSLKRDPAIRYSDDGRALVRWLESRLIYEEDTDRVMRMPAHQMASVAHVARVIATRWNEIATRLETP
ncbi:ParB-like nuclease domain-containing protein [Streptomyces sp. ISL-96]|uniref:ParB/RepB/Spo0J family partition protein n=1 Tax=Streptomyces sp. ISL-96 TaxID=2819191 RepID=UPI001BE91017|nr:ParB/RepB/Spo0J family partition protein [Streptomyces sp. ISL-96]MBT2490560.1 ParB-like nuclease domain-containing protein [Streptomyces sp. ISL-96]